MALHCRRQLGMVVLAACHCGHGREGARALAEVGCRVLEDFDVTDPRSGERATREAEGLELWAVVNNAAVLVFAEAEWQTQSMVETQLKVKVIAVVELNIH